jgi:hypothetical protein
LVRRTGAPRDGGPAMVVDGGASWVSEIVRELWRYA